MHQHLSQNFLKNTGEHGICRRWTYRNVEPGPFHDHDFHEFFWVEKGEGLHCVNGKTRRLFKGLLVLIRPDDVHTFTALEGSELVFTNVTFFSESWHFLKRRYFSGQTVFFDQKTVESREFLLSAGDVALIEAASRPLREGKVDRMMFERLLVDLICMLRTDPFRIRKRSTPRWIRDICQKLTAKQMFLAGTHWLARECGKSPEHLAREFKRYLNKTPTEVLNEARMALAARLLTHTGESISEIAFRCGHENLGHFYERFRNFSGMPPAKYRALRELELEI